MRFAEQWKLGLLWERGIVGPSWREAREESAMLRISWFQ